MLRRVNVGRRIEVAHRQLRDLGERVAPKVLTTPTDQGLLGNIGSDRGRADSEQHDRRSIDRARTVEANGAGATDHREISVTAGRFIDRETAALARGRKPDGHEKLVGLETRRPRPHEKSRAATDRERFLPLMSKTASRASATAGYSDTGIGVGEKPPTVPRERIWKCPINGVARASNGTAVATSGSCSTSSRRTIAPTANWSPCRDIVDNDVTSLRSIKCTKRVSRSASRGTKL